MVALIRTPRPASVPPADAILRKAAVSPELRPADYSDLFDRMRAGFKLPDSDPRRHRPQGKLEWCAGNPDYLGRAFSPRPTCICTTSSRSWRRAACRSSWRLLPGEVESAFEPYAYSLMPAASGLWQFVPGTGSRYNRKQDWWV